MFSLDPTGILRSEALAELDWMEHGFQTRVSTHLPSGYRIATLKQIHSDRVLVADGQNGVLGEADAIISDSPGVLLTIRTADCVPLLIADPVHRAVAAVHAGWRGVVAEVLPRAVEAMKARYGSTPQRLMIAVGPCIRRESFEVGKDVAERFQALFPERDDLDRRATVDLVEGCARQLEALGVQREAIFDCSRCSYLESQDFHSFRRDREESGRMVSFVGIRPGVAG